MPCCTVVEALEPPFTVNRSPPPATPLAVKGTINGDVGSVLRIVSVPLVSPVKDGVKVTLTEQDDAAFSVGIPQVLVTLKSLLAVNPRPSTGSAPTLRSVNNSVLLEPRGTLPNTSDVGATVSSGCVPTPDNATSNGNDVAEVETESVPRSVAVEEGVNTTAMVQDAPAANVPPAAGQGVDEEDDVASEKFVPVTATRFIVIETAPVLVSVANCELLAPTRMRPKSMDCGARETEAALPVPTRVTNSSDATASL